MGHFYYLLENNSKKDRLVIQKKHFDFFRQYLSQLIDLRKQEPLHNMDSPIKMEYLGEVIYSIQSKRDDPKALIITEISPIFESTGTFQLAESALSVLLELLIDPRILNPSETLERILEYNTLYHQSFEQQTESINSDLQYRKQFLSSTVEYVQINEKIEKQESLESNHNKNLLSHLDQNNRPKKSSLGFQVKLGEKNKQVKKHTNFDNLFNQKESPVNDPQSPIKNQKKRIKKKPLGVELPLLASEIKSGIKSELQCDLIQDELDLYKKQFPPTHPGTFLLGFEIVNCINKSGGQFYSYQFPLYYTRVSIVESGSTLFIHFNSDKEFYLNHLALIHAIEKFTDKRSQNDPVNLFLQQLLNQSLKIDKRFDRIQLKRRIPCHEDIYHQTREILFGNNENEYAHKGLFRDLKIIGTEVDLESVYLYKIEEFTTVQTKSISNDLSLIQEKAQETPSAYYRSLLGQFLSPFNQNHHRKDPLFNHYFIPGRRPASMNQLINSLNEQDIALLEGPPGTGKTFSILHVLIGALCEQKRILIVSDKPGAISALTEKIDDYLLGKDRESLRSGQLNTLWQQTIKVLNLVDEGRSLSEWANIIKNALKLEDQFEGSDRFRNENPSSNYYDSIKKIDKEIKDKEKSIQKLLGHYLSRDKKNHQYVSQRQFHPSSSPHIKAFIQFTRLLDSDQSTFFFNLFDKKQKLLKWRDWDLYKELEVLVEASNVEKQVSKLTQVNQLLQVIIKKSPKSIQDLNTLLDTKEDLKQNPFIIKVSQLWEELYQSSKNRMIAPIKKGTSYLVHTGVKRVKFYSLLIEEHLKLVSREDYLIIAPSLKQIYLNYDQQHFNGLSLDFEIFKRFKNNRWGYEKQIQTFLIEIDQLQTQRDILVKKLFISRLENIYQDLHSTSEQQKTSLATRIGSILNDLTNSSGHEINRTLTRDLQQSLVNAFPVWICRKQNVSFLFPCIENLFDLVIVDEATQCKVDDAIPLIYRAKKILAVGDHKQTVLDKNSALDDFLFDHFDLKEQLALSQGSSVKSGGTHLFGLIKNIKKANIMLDEHYRCPPEVIQYSNRFVYQDKLKLMQWMPPGAESNVDISQMMAELPPSERQKSGKYKGIDTQMIDQFFNYMIDQIHIIEAKIGRSINTNTDIAICYFLLKNRPYFEDKKEDFLKRLNRGNEILHGAGAELQGKERDYIFYFWDITKGNMGAFAQGDDELKRKGELNVLMSRPKIKAYHFLHGQFSELNHSKSNIARYLFDLVHRSAKKIQEKSIVERELTPRTLFSPDRRGSGNLIKQILMEQNQVSKDTPGVFSQTIGNPYHKIDFIHPVQGSDRFNAYFDLSALEYDERSATHLVDYYFQLKRATPKLMPHFHFIFELLKIAKK
jgi:hypothetical protein